MTVLNDSFYKHSIKMPLCVLEKYIRVRQLHCVGALVHCYRVFDFMQLEDIYASLYLIKCDAKLSRQKHLPGEKRGIWPKFFTGICTFLVLIFIIWTPMLVRRFY
jgi:hypothetical protein